MKWLEYLTKPLILSGFLLLPFPDTTGACIDQGTGSAILKVGAAVLVGGVFFYNHFRNRINAFVSNLLSRGGKRDGTED